MFVLLLATAGCKKNDTAPSIDQQDSQIADIAYGTDTKQTLDLYLPGDHTDDTKLLIFIHGGGWNAGDKSDYTTVLSDLHGNDFAIANINYRLADSDHGITISQLSEDVRDALDFLIQNASVYGYSASKIIMAGHSAGGHLALYTAYHNNADSAVKAVISMAGPAGLSASWFMDNPDLYALVQNLTGADWNTDSTAWIDASPVTWVSPASPPTLLQYCGLDFTVDDSQGDILANVLAENGVPYILHDYPLYSHDMGTGFFGGHLPPDVKADILSFIAAHAN